MITRNAHRRFRNTAERLSWESFALLDPRKKDWWAELGDICVIEVVWGNKKHGVRGHNLYNVKMDKK